MKLFKYELYNGEAYDDAETIELFSTEEIPKEEWDEMLMGLFDEGTRDIRDACKELLSTGKFFKLEDLISITQVAKATIGTEYSYDGEWEHPTPDACHRKKFQTYHDGTVEYIQDYLEL